MTIATRQNRTLIDTLSAGYSAVNRRLWLLVLPIVASLYFAYGQPVSLAPLLAQARTTLAELPTSDRATTDEAVRLLKLLEPSDMRQTLLWLNYLPFVSSTADNAGPGAFVVHTFGELLAVLALLNGAGLVLSALFLQQVARAVAPGRKGLGLGEWARLLFGLALWAALIVAAGVGVGVPYLVVGALVSALVPPVLPLVVLVFGFIVFWLGVYVGFAAEAMALDGVGPLKASWRSARLVRRNFLPTVGLLVLAWVINKGLGFVWSQLSVGPLGIALACVASAYVGSGLAAARMVYYRERAVS